MHTKLSQGKGRVPALIAGLATWACLAAPALATNQEPNIVSWYNGDPNHTIIMVHGRSARTNHARTDIAGQEGPPHWVPCSTKSTAYWCRQSTFPTPFVCDSPGITAAEKDRCLARLDIKSYWSTLGLSSPMGFHWNATDLQASRNVDFRNAAGDCTKSFGPYKPSGRYQNPISHAWTEGVYNNNIQMICMLPSLNSTTQVFATDGHSVSCPETDLVRETNVTSWKGCAHSNSPSRAAVQTWYGAGAVYSTPTPNYLRNVVFAGYDGDSDPTTFGTDRAQSAIDRAMWQYCSNGKTCTLVCHSAGCYAVGYYLAKGYGPGGNSSTVQSWSGLQEVIAASSAAGGSQIALRAKQCRDNAVCSTVAAIFSDVDIGTPMIKALTPSVAMSRFAHGVPAAQYSWVPTYLIAGHRTDMDALALAVIGWNTKVTNDGAVTYRSQCAGNWTDDAVEKGTCNDIDAKRGTLGYGRDIFYVAGNAYPGFIFAQPHGYNSTRGSFDEVHGLTPKVAVRWLTDLF